jgi:hypothetical protein
MDYALTFLNLVILLVILIKLLQIEKFVEMLKKWEIININDYPEEKEEVSLAMALLPRITKKNRKWWLIGAIAFSLSSFYFSVFLGVLVVLVWALAIFIKAGMSKDADN